jgi:TonB-linked SusC/RagA family outer membrane protein
MKKRLRLYVSLFAAVILCLSVYAQQVIRGTLRSPSGEPLVGATVNVKGTKTTVVTDDNGQFSINAPVGSRLVISYIGYNTQEVTVTDTNPLTVQLQASSQDMQQVVVIGYQTVRRRDLTGATSVVNVADLNKNTASTVAEAMQGLAAGVTVRNTGEPGAGAKIDIRGTGTFGGNNPLYVIDGMLSDATPDFNPNDIESVQVLKDASAAAIYGSRAANGVIIITTKKGRQGDIQVGGNVKVGIEQFHKKWDLMNNTEYAALNKQAYLNSGLTPQGSVDAQFDPNINTNWQDLMMRTGSTQDYSLSLSGGGNTATYYMSGDYFKNKGTIIDNSFERAGFRVNTAGQKGRVKFGENAYFSYVHRDPLEGNVFLDMLSMLPVMPVQGSRYIDENQNPEGWSYGDPAYANTFGTNTIALQKLVQEDFRYYKLRGNAFAEVKFFDWLTYKFNAGLETSFDYYTGFQKPGIVRQGTPYLKPTLNENRSLFMSFLAEHTLNFDRQFGQHKINAVIGISNQTFKLDGLFGQKVGIPAYSGQYYFSPDQSGVPSVSGNVNKWAYLGYLGRVNYSYADRYLLSATFRRDGSSLFGPAYRWGNFPSISAAWRISRESFFTVDKISDLKIRASYGQLGNSEILTPFEYSGNISAFPRYVFGTNQTITYGATNIQLANPDLHWETKKTTNIGLDAAFLNNKVTLSADYFIVKTSDVLTHLPIALTTGNAGGNPPVNAASLKNTGFELTAAYHRNNRPFQWNLTLNLTSIKNTVTSLGDIGDKSYIQLGDTRTQAGHSIGEWYVLKTAGIFQNQQEIDAYVDKNGQKIEPWAQAGDIKYVDVDGDGTINFDKDRTWAGSPWPKLQGGLIWDAMYKNFNFSMQWYGVTGNKLYDRPLYNMDKLGPNDNQAYRAGIQPWTSQNPSTDIPRIGIVSPGHPDDGLQNNALPQTDRWLENGSYLRLRILEIGYTFPGSKLSHIGFSSARVYLSGQNLLTFTKYKGLDPDIVGPNIFERGLDNGQYPALRIYSLGIQFGL